MKLFGFSILFLILTSLAAAQEFKPDDEIPIDNKITTGVLDNGLKYFIRENKKPEDRAELRLVVNVGSVLEDENQQGLAHFVEHMAFNGTKNFKKNDLISYLESIGMKFGADINAYTSFDETIYMLQIPTDQDETLDKGFQILEDWAHNVSFDDEEIDKERGVIIEEWRLGRGASARMRDKQFPILFKGSRYAERLPIGKKDILENFKHETLKRFYKEWYRPDLMAVIAVGDFDKAKIENLIKKHFSKIKNVENEKPRKFFPVPDQDHISFAMASDPEATSSGVSVFYKLGIDKQDKVKNYKQRLTELLYNRMFSSRLRELSLKPNPPFVTAYSSKEDIIRTKAFYYLGASVKDGEVDKGLEVLLTEAARIKKFGFTESELQRRKDELLRYIETSYNERDKSESAKYAGEYIRHFLEGEPVPGIEYEYELQKAIIPTITLEDVDALSREWMNKDDCVVLVNAPAKKGLELPKEEELLSVFEKVKNKKLEPYIDDVADQPLVEKIPSAGKIIKEDNVSELNVTELTLSNGVKVVLKPTDFKNDEIDMRAFSPGGNSLVSNEDYIAAATASQLINQSGVGAFNNTELEKKLAGKVVRVAPYISELTEGFLGSSSSKDVETMFQLIYLYFTSPRIDSSAFLSYISKVKTLVANREKSPEAAFNDTLSLTLAQYNPRRYPWTEKTVDKMNMEKSFEIYKDRFSDASDFTFLLVGSFDVEKIKPLIETYLGNLPSIKRQESYTDIGIRPPKGVIKKEVRKGIEQKGYVDVTFTGPFEWTQENSYLLKSMTSAVRIKLREVLREDKSGTYGIRISSTGKHAPDEEYQIEISFGCDPTRINELVGTLFTQLDSIRNYSLDETYIERVKEMQIRENEVQRKENDYWVKTLTSYYFYDMDLSDIYKNDDKIEKLDNEEIQETAKKYFNMNNYVMVVLYPENS